MIWYLFFVLLLIIISTPIPLKFELSFDILHLKGEIKIKLIYIYVLKTKVFVKNGYIFYSRQKTYAKRKIKYTKSKPSIFYTINKKFVF